MLEKMRVSIDVMGGDHAPASPLVAVDAVLKERNDVEFILCGNKVIIEEYIDQNLPTIKDHERITIKHAEQIIGDNDPS